MLVNRVTVQLVGFVLGYVQQDFKVTFNVRRSTMRMKQTFTRCGVG